MEFKILLKKLNQNLTHEEEKEFDNWYQESVKHRDYFNSVKNNYLKEDIDVNVEKSWKKLNSKLHKKSNKIGYWKYAAAAAILILIASQFIYFNKTSPEHKSIENIVSIHPGTNKAVLTLEDGSIVTLEKGKKYQSKDVTSNGEELVYSSDNTKDRSTKIEYNYLTIPRGGEFFIELSDHTKVWLNSASKIKYPIIFTKGETREVELIYGEAYFEVSHSTNHAGAPFEVLTQNQSIEVLGTEFNIKAYPDDDLISTTLVNGKVAIEDDSGTFRKHLKPGQQSTYYIKTEKIKITMVDVDNEISWREGFFSFREESLQNIAKVLSRWYDIDFVFENKAIANVKFNGSLSKNQNIENVLRSIKNSATIEYKINGKTIIIK